MRHLPETTLDSSDDVGTTFQVHDRPDTIARPTDRELLT